MTIDHCNCTAGERTTENPSARSLRVIIEDAKALVKGRSLKDLTVLSASRDPYRLDTPAGHIKGQWLADSYHAVNPSGRRIHSRGLHYLLVGRVTKPDGSPYVNDDETWTWLSESAIKCARFLGYLPWDALRDARNAPPMVFKAAHSKPSWELRTAEVDVYLPFDLEPRLRLVGDLYRQPWQQIVIAEKQGVADLLAPIVEGYKGTLALPAGELSDTMLYELLRDAAADGRPLAIHQLGDFDPAGNQMAVSTARTAQALRDLQFPDLEIRVHAVGLTLEQVREWDLPATPLKETEKRADRWLAATGRAQTELDAAIALAPREFAKTVRASMNQYHDRAVARRASSLREELEAEANARLAEQMNDETMALIRYRAEAKLEEIQSAAKEVNDALAVSIEFGDFTTGTPPVLIGETAPTARPLFDSQEEWATATRRLKARKAFAEGSL